MSMRSEKAALHDTYAQRDEATRQLTVATRELERCRNRSVEMVTEACEQRDDARAALTRVTALCDDWRENGLPDKDDVFATCYALRAAVGTTE